MTELCDVVAPELEPYRFRHPKAVDVEDAATNAELCDILYHWYTLEANCVEMSGELLWPSSIALAQLESGRRERA